eukprot:scaffold22320_cov63-Phaeocystis_antarctica.AAC.2
MAERAAVEAEKQAAKQAAVQQAKAEAAAKAAKAAVKAATKRAARKMEENAAAEQSEEKTEKAAGDKTTKQEEVSGSVSTGTRPCFHASAVWRSHAKPICPPVAPGLRNAFRNCSLSGSETSMRFALRRQTGFPHLNHQAKKATLSFYRVIGIFLPIFMLALRQHCSAVDENRAACVVSWPLGPIWAKMGLLSGVALEAVVHREASAVCIFAWCELGFLLKTKHTRTHFNQQEQPSVHHARSAAAHAKPATPGASVDKQRQPAA